MKIKLIISICATIVLFFPNKANSNSWHSHLSYYQVIAIAQSDQQIFAANRNGLFSYRLKNKTFDTWSRVEGLSDSGISAICWSASKGGLLIGYSDGNLDLLLDNKILNLPFIKDKASIPVKSINNIYCEGDFAWLSCDFGIVKVNVKRWDVAETWMIGPQATSIVVNELTADDRYFWAATEAGVFRADKSNPNLQDYQNWVLQDKLPFPREPFNSISVFNQSVLTCDLDGRTYSYDGTSWQQVYSNIGNVKKIKGYPSALLFVCSGSLNMVGTDGFSKIVSYGDQLPSSTKIDPADALIGTTGELWIGDQTFGLFERTGNQAFVSLVPSSPTNNNAQTLTSEGANLFVATGTDETSQPSVQAALYRLTGNKWVSINGFTETKLNGIKNIMKVVPTPSDPEHFFASTLANGLLEFQGSKLVKQYNSMNSTLESFNGNCAVGGLAFDSTGNLWVTNPKGNNQLDLVKPDGTWKALNYSGINNQFISAGDLIITKSDTKWIIVDHSSLFAIKTKTTPENQADDVYKKSSVYSRFTNSTTTIIKGFNVVNCFAEDHDGYLWLGTENGVVLYTNPEAIFGTAGFYGAQPSVDLGDGVFHPVLENENVTSVAIDGGNRKWFGTSNSGVFLFSNDGSRLIRNFNTDNSPLFSNHINSIAIDGQNGEIFFATGNGLISWMGDATEGEGSFHNLYVWPNPVRESYSGEITIDGLTDQSTVKITDVAGNLVYRTTSIGGRATWNGRTGNGNRPGTGVYLIFCADSDGNQSRVIKLLFIH